MKLNKKESWAMFNRIAKRYDLMNRLMTLGLDLKWRKNMANYLPKTKEIKILDLATGTADVPLLLLQKNQNISHITGMDLSEKMLEIGKEKTKNKKEITLKSGSMNKIPEKEETFNAITVAFGIRNTDNLAGALKEMYRVLKPGGNLIILETSIPRNPILKVLHQNYIRHIMPLLGGLLSGDKSAYVYLNKTIETFPHGKKLTDLIEQAGFRTAKDIPQTFGVSSIYVGEK